MQRLRIFLIGSLFLRHSKSLAISLFNNVLHPGIPKTLRTASSLYSIDLLLLAHCEGEVEAVGSDEVKGGGQKMCGRVRLWMERLDRVEACW